MNSSRTSPSGKGPRSIRWPIAAATVGVLPLWWIVRAVTDQAWRSNWSTADFWFGVLVTWGPWLILACAILRKSRSRAARGALAVGWFAVAAVAGAMASAGDGGGVPQGGINAGIYKMLLLSCQYACASIAAVAAWGLDWFARLRTGVESGDTRPAG